MSAILRMEAAYHELAAVAGVPLLVQLASAVYPGAAGGHGGSAGASLPLSSNAFDLLRRIERTVDERWRRLGNGRGERTLRHKLRAWADAARHSDDPEVAEDAERYMTGWVEAIHELLDPPRTIEVLAPCPVCREWWALNHYDDEGSAVYSPAVTIRIVHGLVEGAECSACSTSWPRQFVPWLATLATSEPLHDPEESTP